LPAPYFFLEPGLEFHGIKFIHGEGSEWISLFLITFDRRICKNTD